jgi:hypothetical protein
MVQLAFFLKKALKKDANCTMPKSTALSALGLFSWVKIVVMV